MSGLTPEARFYCSANSLVFLASLIFSSNNHVHHAVFIVHSPLVYHIFCALSNFESTDI